MGMAAVEFGRRIVQAESEPGNTAAILHTLDSFTPGSKWSGTFFVDAFSGKPLRDIILLYQDTYILGRGYLHTRDVSIPKEYFLTGFSFSSEAKDIRQSDDDGKVTMPEEVKSGAGSK
jgi:hypothetical protein